MSGWDMSSTPTWGQNDGPEESTQSFPVSGTGSRGSSPDFDERDDVQRLRHQARGSSVSGFPGDAGPGGPPPEFSDADQDTAGTGPGRFPKRTPGQSMRQDLPRREARGRHSSPAASYAADSDYGADNGFGQDSGSGQNYGLDSSFGQEPAFGREPAFGQDSAFGREPAFGQDSALGRDAGFGPGTGPAPGRNADWGAAPDAGPTWGAEAFDSSDDSGWGRVAGRSVPPWEERPEPEFGQAGRQEPRPAAGAPARLSQDDYPDRPGFRSQRASGPSEPETVARMDPALQDFFASPGQRQESGRQESARSDGGRFDGRPGPGAPGSGPGQPSPGPRRPAPSPYAELDPSRIGQPSTPRYRQTDGWGVSDGRPAPSRNGTGPRPAATGARHQESGGLSGATVTIGLAVIVLAVVGVGAFLLLHHSGGPAKPGNAAASHRTATTHAAKPKKSATAKTKSTSKAKGGTTAAGAFLLSTPSTAGGYPKGQDPHFLATATATAQSIASAVTSGGGGTVKGSPVSAAYQLPSNGQVITFVGYHGTFSPAKVATILASLGTDQNTYPAGPNGGSFGCANTPATAAAPSGAVCAWATSSTLGITEFFSATGPEALTVSQAKGATDALRLRADVEKKKS